MCASVVFDFPPNNSKRTERIVPYENEIRDCEHVALSPATSNRFAQSKPGGIRLCRSFPPRKMEHRKGITSYWARGDIGTRTPLPSGLDNGEFAGERKKSESGTHSTWSPSSPRIQL